MRWGTEQASRGHRLCARDDQGLGEEKALRRSAQRQGMQKPTSTLVCVPVSSGVRWLRGDSGSGRQA